MKTAMSKRAIEKAYETYPLDESNRYNNELNAKRVGFQQGYEQSEKDTIERAAEWLSSIENGDKIVDVKAFVEAFKNEIREDE